MFLIPKKRAHEQSTAIEDVKKTTVAFQPLIASRCQVAHVI